MKLKTVAMISLFSFFLAGCETTGTKIYLSDLQKNEPEKKLTLDDVNVPTDYYLVDKTWMLSTINGEAVENNVIVTMKFQNGFNKSYPVMLSGKSGCNSYTTDLKVGKVSKALELSNEFTITRKVCFEENIMDVEKLFINAIKDNEKIVRKNQTQIILEDDKKRKFLFEKI